MLTDVFKKRKLPDCLMIKTENKEQTVNTEIQIQGSRIMNMDKLLQYTDELNAHSSRCKGAILLSGESRNGLASILKWHCDTCEHTIILETSKKVKGPVTFNLDPPKICSTRNQFY